MAAVYLYLYLYLVRCRTQLWFLYNDLLDKNSRKLLTAPAIDLFVDLLSFESKRLWMASSLTSANTISWLHVSRRFLILILKVAIDATGPPSTELFLSGDLLSHCNFSFYWSIELLRPRIGVQGLLVLGSALYFWWIPPRMLIYFDVSLYWSL